MKVLIIEDDPQAAAELSDLLEALDASVDILDCLRTVEESVRWVLSKPLPDLILLDVNLPDGTCFDIFREVKLDIPIIFTTSHPEFALKAMKVMCVDYLIKPVDRNALISAFYKYKLMREHFSPKTPHPEPELGSRPDLIKTSKSYKNRFRIQLGDKIKFVKAEDIAFFRAEGNVVYLITNQKDSFIIEHSLEALNDFLDPDLFFRLNRTYISHIHSIREVRKYFNSRLKIYLEPRPEKDEEILVSRNRVHEFLRWLGY